MSYPNRDEEIQVLKQTTANRNVALKKVINGAKILELQKMIRDIPVSDHVFAYCADLVRMTRPNESGVPDFIRKNLNFYFHVSFVLKS